MSGQWMESKRNSLCLNTAKINRMGPEKEYLECI